MFSNERCKLSFVLVRFQAPTVTNMKNIIFLMLIKIQPDATVCKYLFTAKPLYRFRVSQHPSSGVLKTVTAASGTGHTVKYKD